MAKPLLPDELWEKVEPLLPPPPPPSPLGGRPRKADRACLTGILRRRRAAASCSKPASSGKTFHERWAAGAG